MHWAEYRTNSPKAKLHLGFGLNHGVPHKLFLTEGNGAERPFVSRIIEPGQKEVTDDAATVVAAKAAVDAF